MRMGVTWYWLLSGALLLLTLPSIIRMPAIERAVGDALVAPLETRFSPPTIDNWSAIAGVVVLGGTPTRLLEAMKVVGPHPNVKLVLSGPTDDELKPLNEMPEPFERRVEIERESIGHGTWGNAVQALKLARPRNGERWLLITSALHMPRAMGAFRAAGFDIEPWPVMDTSSYPPARLRMAVHEWLGLAAYWLCGRSNAAFPN